MSSRAALPSPPPGNDFVRHNAWQLTRIYPSGMRTDSSNYSPQEMWNAGCQIGTARGCERGPWGCPVPPRPISLPPAFPPVALNFQTAGTEMDLCDGLFSQNGRCGYVLKPPFMRDEGTLFNPTEPGTREGPGPITLTIQVGAEEGPRGAVRGALMLPAGCKLNPGGGPALPRR